MDLKQFGEETGPWVQVQQVMNTWDPWEVACSDGSHEVFSTKAEALTFARKKAKELGTSVSKRYNE